jgi:hypothetical protein
MRAVFELPAAQAMVLERTGADGRAIRCLRTVAFRWQPNA